MSWLPKSPKARRRLWVFIAVAPVLALAVALSLYAMRDSVTFFFSPSEATPETAPAGRVVRLGGLVETGSVVRDDSGQVAFAVTDNVATTRVVYRGDLPDLFAEGQGVVAQGAFLPDRSFRATQVLAKHDETYMPREVADSLKAKGEWRPVDSADPRSSRPTADSAADPRSSRPTADSAADPRSSRPTADSAAILP